MMSQKLGVPGFVLFYFYSCVVFQCVNVLELFIHSSTVGHLGCFHILTIVNNAAMNKGVLVFFLVGVLVILRYIPRSGIAGSNGSFIFSF